MIRKLFPLFAVAVFVASAFGQSAAQLSSEAQRAYVAGDIDTAKAKFKLALQIDPQNVAARNYLRIIQTQEAKAGGGAELEKKLRPLIVPVKFQDATFSSALEYLRQQAAKQSVPVSFVSQLPQEMMEHKVTLNLTNTPFLEALRYLCELNGAKARMEKYAIVIKKAGGDEPPASPATQ